MLADRVAKRLGKAASVRKDIKSSVRSPPPSPVTSIMVEGNRVFDLVEEVTDALQCFSVSAFLLGEQRREGDMISRGLAAADDCRENRLRA